MKRLLLSATLTLSALLFSMQSHAILITSDATINDDNRITFVYNLEGTSLAVNTIDFLFDPTLFDNIELDINTLPQAWLFDVFQREAIDIDTFLEGLVSVFTDDDVLLLAGETLNGLTISADYLGSDAPNSITQQFELFDFDFNGIGDEELTTIVSKAEVNAPAGILFLLTGAGLFLVQRKTAKGSKHEK